MLFHVQHLNEIAISLALIFKANVILEMRYFIKGVIFKKQHLEGITISLVLNLKKIVIFQR